MNRTIRVLVVDDEPGLAELTGLRLERYDDAFETTAETSAAAGLDHIGEVDCVVSDYDMPETDGLEFLAAVREREPELPFVLFTGKGSEEIASRAISAGVTDYLQKGSGGERYEMLANRVRNAVERSRAERELERTETRYRRLVEQNLFGIYILQGGRLEYANPRLASMLGYERSELIGTELERVIDPEDMDRVEENVRRRVDGEVEETQYTVTAYRKDGTPIEVEVNGGRIEHEGEPAVMGALVEVSDRERRLDALDALHGATRRLLRTTDREAVGGVVVDAMSGVLGHDVNGVFVREGDELVPLASSSEGVEIVGPPPNLPLEDSIAGRIYRAGEPRLVEDVQSDDDVHDPETPVRSVLYLPIGDHGILFAGTTVPADLDDRDLSLARTLAAAAEAAMDRAEREERLGELHAATRELMTAESAEAIAEVAVEAARDVLGHELNGIHLVDGSGERLDPIAISDRSRELIGEPPALPVEGSLAGEAFRAGETRTYDDVREAAEAANPDSVMRRELIVPLGREGVFIAGGTEPGPFEETRVSLAKVFCSNIEAALARAHREEAVRERERELRRQNDRLEEFAGVVSHDLRNPLEVAQGYTELAREDGDSEELAAVARAHDRLAARIDDLLTLARHGASADETEPVAVGDLGREVWAELGDTDHDGGDASGEPSFVVEESPTVRADPERLRLLLENLFANAVRHGGGGRESDGDPVTVRIGSLRGENGFYVADDGPGIPEDERETVFTYGHTTAEEGGSGIGLAVVRTIAEAHGWTVRVVESDAGGARFEIAV